MRTIIAAAVMAAGLAIAPAHASMGISCSFEDEIAQFYIRASVTTGMGSPIYAAQNELKVSTDEVGNDLLVSQFGPDDLKQYWYDGDEIRLLFYRERPSDMPTFGSVQLEIRTIGFEEGGFNGRYQLILTDLERSSDAVYYEGPVACMSG